MMAEEVDDQHHRLRAGIALEANDHLASKTLHITGLIERKKGLLRGTF